LEECDEDGTQPGMVIGGEDGCENGGVPLLLILPLACCIAAQVCSGENGQWQEGAQSMMDVEMAMAGAYSTACPLSLCSFRSRNTQKHTAANSNDCVKGVAIDNEVWIAWTDEDRLMMGRSQQKWRRGTDD